VVKISILPLNFAKWRLSDSPEFCISGETFSDKKKILRQYSNSPKADAQLFRKMINNKEHCIHQLLPPEKKLYP